MLSWGMDSDFMWHQFDDDHRTALCSAAIDCYYPRLGDVLLEGISEQHSLENGGSHCPVCCAFNYATDAQHLADVRHKQDGGGREGWASTDPGRTKYHHYDASGQSKCNYKRQHGPLTFHSNPKALEPKDCCSSCDLHILKAEQVAAIKPAPKSDRLRVGWASIDTPDSPYHFWNSNGAKVCTYEGEHRPRFFYPDAGQPKQLEACPRCWAHTHPSATTRPRLHPAASSALQQLSLF